MLGSGVWSQETSSSEFTLEEITVTAEKRAVNLQTLPASVRAIEGADLMEQGKVTTAQILESVPNVTYRTGYGTNPDGNIAIRGIQRTQKSGGIDEILPATTAVYVDGIYQGIGGHYDVNRVEVLRGPQGTLYGRSATGGVIAFYTNDPRLNKFSGGVSAEYGNYSLINAEGVINVPVGDKVALRASAHYYTKDGYFDNPEGGKTETKEGRLKVLFQPADPLRIVVSGAIQKSIKWGGGWSITMPGPDTFNYKASWTDPSTNPDDDYWQVGVNANYDFGNSTFTWIGGMHDYKHVGFDAPSSNPEGGEMGLQAFPKNFYHTEELRWASDTEGPITWLVGANYFYNEYEHNMGFYQTWSIYVPEQYWGIPIPSNDVKESGNFKNYGLFTEETFKLREDLRITAGLRYDYTKFVQSSYKAENLHTIPGQHAFLPPIENGVNYWVSGTLKDYPMDWHNITYKLRFEYDMTPDNMVYFTTATGFLPGYASAGPDVNPMGFQGFNYRVLDEQKLTSYEVGTKNQFLDNRLRLNSSVFYYDMAGYPEVVELVTTGRHGTRQTITSEIKVIGAEAEIEYLMTMNDKISLNAGYERPKITGYSPSTITWTDGAVTDAKAAMIMDIQPGHPKLKASMAYDHMFNFSNGSTLVPRVEVNYTGAYYLSQLNYYQVGLGYLPYVHQDALMLCNANVAWTSASQKYSVTAWVRNAFDTVYKTAVGVAGTNLSNTSGTPGDPRTFGAMINVKF